MAQHQPGFWSSCCGEPAAYIGFYQCPGCGNALNLGRSRPPHLVDATDGARIRELAADEQPSLAGGRPPAARVGRPSDAGN